MIRKLQLFILLLGLPFTADAALVTFQSSWDYLLHPASSGVSGIGLFTFTVEDTTPVDSVTGNPPFQNAVYLNAITSATLNLGPLTLSLDSSKENKVYIYNKDRSGGADAAIRVFMMDSEGEGYDVHFGFEMRRDLTTLSLANLDGLNNEDDNGGNYIDPDSCTVNPFVCGYSLRQIGFQTVVPLPSSAWLLASGLAGVFLRRSQFNRRKNRD